MKREKKNTHFVELCIHAAAKVALGICVLYRVLARRFFVKCCLTFSTRFSVFNFFSFFFFDEYVVFFHVDENNHFRQFIHIHAHIFIPIDYQQQQLHQHSESNTQSDSERVCVCMIVYTAHV